MDTSNNRQSTVINIMKGLLPILVVVLHTSYDASLQWGDGVEPFLRVLIAKLAGIAVPSFFLISGYFFFTKLGDWKWNAWGGKLRKRARTLLVPFLLWIALDFVAKYVWGIAKSEVAGGLGLASLQDFFCNEGGLRMFWDRPQHTSTVNLLGLILDTSKPINGPMWYVRDLMVMMVFAPLIWWLLKVTRGWIITVFFLLHTFDIGFPFILFSPTALFFFSVGAVFSIRGTEFLDAMRRWRLPSYLTAALLLTGVLALDGSLWGEVVFRIFVCIGVVACFCAVDALYGAGCIRECKLLTDSSFFIYASHAVLITEISNFLLWRALPITAEWMLVLKVFLRPAVAVGICLLLYVGMKKFAPRTLGILTGGRG